MLILISQKSFWKPLPEIQDWVTNLSLHPSDDISMISQHEHSLLSSEDGKTCFDKWTLQQQPKYEKPASKKVREMVLINVKSRKVETGSGAASIKMQRRTINGGKPPSKSKTRFNSSSKV